MGDRRQSGDCPTRVPYESTRQDALRSAISRLWNKPRELHVCRACDLDVALASGDDADFNLFQALDQTRFIRADEAVLPRFVECLAQQFVAKYLRSLRQDESFTGQGLTNLVEVNELDCIYRHDADNRRASLSLLR